MLQKRWCKYCTAAILLMMAGHAGPKGPDEDEVQSGGGSGHRWTLRILGGVVIVVGAVVVVLIMRPPQTDPTGHDPSTPPHASQGPKVSSVDLSWLDASSDWELFARTDNSVVRVQVRKGRVTHTRVPTLHSGPVQFVVRRDAAFVHPIDSVPGYVVPDGHQARRSQDQIPDGGTLLPGPKPNQLWVQRDEAESSSFDLVTLKGRPTGVSVDPPRTVSGFARSDGSGHVLLRGTGGVYHLRQGQSRRITHGRVVATGPQAWVITECRRQPQCRLVVVDPSNGDRHPLPGDLDSKIVAGGATSPDGSTAALVVSETANHPRLFLIDLTTGKQTAVQVTLPTPGPPSPQPPAAMTWSPQGQWLFIVQTFGSIQAIDPRSGQARPLGLHLASSVRQLAIRP